MSSELCHGSDGKGKVDASCHSQGNAHTNPSTIRSRVILFINENTWQTPGEESESTCSKLLLV